MLNRNIRKFLLGIVIPSLLAICMFILSIYLIIIPTFEKTIMERKKEMIRELTTSAWSLIHEYDAEYKNGSLTLEQAKTLAASKIEQMRYGKDRKDYFWITDEHPVMIMHPYREELNGTDLSDYSDPKGTKLFVEAVKVIDSCGEGYINYMWQWKDDTSRIVPKLSYVKGYKEWNWIVGTGIYLEDVKQEIKALKGRLLKISFVIIVVITIIILFVIKQSLRIENIRRETEEKLFLSRQKYKSLVEASTEGTLMLIDKKIIFSNLKLNNMLGVDSADIESYSFEDIFEINWRDVLTGFTDPHKSISLETKLKCINKPAKDVIISVSKIKLGKKDGYVIITKDVTTQKRIEKGSEELAEELQTSLLLMNQPIRHFVKEIVKCNLNTSIGEAVRLMTRKKQKILFITQDDKIIGVVNDSDLKYRVLAKDYNINLPVSNIMTSPVVAISDSALLYEAVILIKEQQVSHLAVKNIENNIIGMVYNQEVLEMQRNSVSYLIKEVEVAEDLDSLKVITARIPVLINALLNSGDKTLNITRIITSVSDAITCRIIELITESIGKPPCKFAFIALGSEGRKEQTLNTDQDNAIIFEDLNKSTTEEAYTYFQELGNRVNDWLGKAGYKLCIGEIMARNKKWCQPLSIWKEYFNGWIINSDPQSILDAAIFFDFRCIYGEEEFTKELRKHIDLSVNGKAVFFHHMAQSIIKMKTSLSSLGGKTIDIKKVLMPITGFIRIYSILNSVTETNSMERLQKLLSMGIITSQMHNDLKVSYNYLMQLRFRFQTYEIMNNENPDNRIDISELTPIEVTTLKKILSEIGNLQTRLNFDFKGGTI